MRRSRRAPPVPAATAALPPSKHLLLHLKLQPQPPVNHPALFLSILLPKFQVMNQQNTPINDLSLTPTGNPSNALSYPPSLYQSTSPPPSIYPSPTPTDQPTYIPSNIYPWEFAKPPNPRNPRSSKRRYGPRLGTLPRNQILARGRQHDAPTPHNTLGLCLTTKSSIEVVTRRPHH